MEESVSSSEIDKSRPKIIFLPDCKDSEDSPVKDAALFFNYQRFMTNLGLLEDSVCSELSLPPGQQKDFYLRLAQNLQPLLRQLRAKHERYQDFAEISSIRETLSQRLPGLARKDSPEKISYSEAEKVIKSIFRKSSQPTIVLSNSHGTSYSEIKAAKDLCPTATIGLVIFDHHLDFFCKESCWGGLEKSALAKRNVIAHLLDTGLVRAVSIAGVPSEARNSLLGEGKPMREYLDYHQDQISIVKEEDYLEQSKNEVQFNKEKYLEQILRQFDFLKTTRVKNILFLIDVDVLRSGLVGYTTAEYSPTALAIALSFFDFSDLKTVAISHLEEKERTPEIIERQMKREIISSVTDPTFTAFPLPDNLVLKITRPTKIISGYGLPLSAIGRAIEVIKREAANAGMQMGVNLPAGGVFLGDVTELSGPDYNDNTAKAVKILIKKICS